MAEPKSFKVEDLKEFFGESGVAALAEQIARSRKEKKVATLEPQVQPDDWGKALRVLEGHLDRDSMNAMRRVALAYVVENRELFASWLDAHVAALEIEEPEAEPEPPVVDELEPMEEPEEVFDDEE